MDNDSIGQIILLVFFLIASSYFSSAETALLACNKIRIQTFAKKGDKKAKKVLKIFENRSKMLSTLLVGNNIANIGSATLTTSLTLRYLGNYAVSISTGILTIVILISGEIIPKNVATIHSDKMVRSYASSILFLMFILTPIVFLINAFANFIVKILRLNKSDSKTITEQELKALIDVGEKEGVIEKEEKLIINNILDFTDAKAKEVMTQRIDMVFINVNDSLSTIIETFKEYRFTRLPVYDKTKDEVIGILNIKDLLVDIDNFNVKDLMHPPHFTYENKAVGNLLLEMRNSNINLIIVLDEYGITAGLITLEDLLEELVGEIRDEYDFDENDEVIKNGDGTYTIDAMTKLDDINSYFNLSLSGDGYDSIAGYIVEQLDHIPKVGEFIIEGNIKFLITKIENNRIITISARIKK